MQSVGDGYFFVNVPVGIVAVTMFMYSLPNFKLPDVKKVIDYSGIITFTLSISAFFIGLSLARDLNAYPLAEIIGLFVFSAFMLILFIWAEKRQKNQYSLFICLKIPYLPFHLWKTF